MFRTRFPPALAHRLLLPRVMHAVRGVPHRPAASAPQRSLARSLPVAHFSTDPPPTADSPPTSDPPIKTWTFAEVRAISQRGAKRTWPRHMLIDVREPTEILDSGTIPSSHHLPRSVSRDAFEIGAGEFRMRFDFDRPAEDDVVVFFCKSGYRSLEAALDARNAGWTQVGNYAGSWDDWVQNGGERWRTGNMGNLDNER